MDRWRQNYKKYELISDLTTGLVPDYMVSSTDPRSSGDILTSHSRRGDCAHTYNNVTKLAHWTCCPSCLLWICSFRNFFLCMCVKAQENMKAEEENTNAHTHICTRTENQISPSECLTVNFLIAVLLIPLHFLLLKFCLTILKKTNKQNKNNLCNLPTVVFRLQKQVFLWTINTAEISTIWDDDWAQKTWF